MTSGVYWVISALAGSFGVAVAVLAAIRAEVALKRRWVTTIVIVASSLLCVVTFFAGGGVRQAEDRAAGQERARMVESLRPVAEELTKLGFKAPAGRSFGDPGLYEFREGTRHTGDVEVTNTSGKVIWVQFQVTSGVVQVGCSADDFLEIDSSGARLLMATDSGCSAAHQTP